MPKEPTRSDDDLPVTLEVGDEGGSYADAVVQEATRDGDLTKVDPAASPGDRDRQHSPASPPPNAPDDGVHFPRRTDH